MVKPNRVQNHSKTFKSFTSYLEKGVSIEEALNKVNISFSTNLLPRFKTKQDFKLIEKVRKAIVYTPFTKKVIKENPNLLKNFLRLFKNKKQDSYISIDHSYKIKRIRYRKKKVSQRDKVNNGFNIKEAFILEVNIDNVKRHFFIKYEETSEKLNHNTYSQFFASQIQKLFGLNIIEPHLAYTTIGKVDTGFLVSDLSNLITLRQARKQNLISKKEYLNLFKKIQNIEKEINRLLPNLYLNLVSEKLTLKDILPKSVFVDLNSKEFFFFDPWLAKDNLYTKIFFYLQRITKINI